MRILLVTSRYPWPPRRGDQLRTVQTAEVLGPGHRLTLLMPEPPAGAPPPAEGPWEVVFYRPGGIPSGAVGGVRAVAAGRPVQTGLMASSRDLRRQLRRLAPAADRVILQLVRLAPLAEELRGAPLVVDLIDSLSLNFERRAACDRPWLRAALRAEAGWLARLEDRLLARAEWALVVCARDREHLAARASPEVAARLAVAPLMMEPRPEADGHAAPAPLKVVMTGNLGYFPNVDAGVWFCRRAWPEVLRHRPDARLVLAGARPARRLTAAAGAAGGQLMPSPSDVAAVLAGAAVAVAPLRCGSGLPIKVLEAWSLGVPVVASHWAAAGTTGEAGRDFLVCREPGDVRAPEEWAGAVLELGEGAELRRRLAEGGRLRLAEDYSAVAVAEAWHRVLPTL